MSATQSTGVTVRPAQLRKILAKAIPHNIPVLITGAPGIGKSSIVAQSAREAGYDLEIAFPVLDDPTNYKGLPWAEAGAKVADFLPFGQLARVMQSTRPIVLFLDDLGQALPAVQAACMSLILNREVNGVPLPEHVSIMGATNRRADRAGVSGILEPVKSRFGSILELQPTSDDWFEWAASAGQSPVLMALMRIKPELLFEHKPTPDMTNSPNPRTWSFVSRWLDLGMDDDVLFPTIAGAVGAGAAAEVVGMIRMMRDLPTPDEIFLDPRNAPVPEEPSALYAIASALGYYASSVNFGALIEYAKRMPQEYGVLAIRDAQRRDRKVVNTTAYTQFILSDLGKAVMGQR